MWAMPARAPGDLHVSPTSYSPGDVLLAALMGMTTAAQLQAMDGIAATLKSQPTTGYSGQRSTINSLPTHSFRDAGTPNWNAKWQHPLSSPRNMQWPGHKKRKWLCARHCPRSNIPIKNAEKVPLTRTPQGEPHWEAFSKDSKVVKVARQDLPPDPPEACLCTGRVLWSHPWFSGIWTRRAKLLDPHDIQGSGGLDWPWQGLKAANHALQKPPKGTF